MGAVVLGLSAYAGYRTYDAYHGVSESDLLLANAEALADPREGNSLWFSNLRNVEYTYYGSKWKCEREVTINTCNTSNETPCE